MDSTSDTTSKQTNPDLAGFLSLLSPDVYWSSEVDSGVCEWWSFGDSKDWKGRCWRCVEGPSFVSCANDALVNHGSNEASSPDYPVLGTNFSKCLLHSIVLHSFVCTLHNKRGERVLFGQEYWVFRGEWNSGILKSPTTSPHLVFILEKIELHSPSEKLGVFFQGRLRIDCSCSFSISPM